jgi:hypothetical protein
VRGRFGTQSVSYRLQYPIHVAHDFIVPEPQDSIVVFEQPTVARLVQRIFSVLAAVDFEDQSFLAADKINNISTNRLLPNELVTVDRP